MNKILVACLFYLSMPLGLLAQKQPVPITLSFFNEATAIPFTRFFTIPIHPGVQFGTEIDYTQKRHFRVFQTANLSYYYHNYLAQGIGFSTELGYEYRTKLGVALGALLGAGYMHTFTTAEEFTFSNGQYVKKPDTGNSRLYPSFSIDVGYYPKKIRGPKFYIRYQSWAEYPYSPGFIPIMTHINLHVGAKFFINNPK